MTQHDPRTAIEDMIEYSNHAMTIASTRTREDLDLDIELSLALARAVEIVGEAAGHVPPAMRARYPAVPWGQIVGMRNRLIHAYRRVDHDVLWRAVKVELPTLIVNLRRMLADEEQKA